MKIYATKLQFRLENNLKYRQSVNIDVPEAQFRGKKHFSSLKLNISYTLFFFSKQQRELQLKQD